jgi:tricorn protease
LLFDDYGQNGALSPDGKKLLFTREGAQWWRKGYHGSQASQIWLFDSESKNFRKVLDPDRGALWPMWKPDGKGFYYVGGQSGSFNLWDYDLTTGENRQMTKFTDDSVVYPCISRDGSTIVFRHLFDLYRLKPGNGEPQKIAVEVNGDRPAERKDRRTLTTANQVAFTPDGLEVAFTAGGDLWVMDTELREPKQVTATAEEERSPVFAPDGESVLFTSDAGGRCDIWRAEKADKAKYWFQNAKFKLTKVTTDGAHKQGSSRAVATCGSWTPTARTLAGCSARSVPSNTTGPRTRSGWSCRWRIAITTATFTSSRWTGPSRRSTSRGRRTTIRTRPGPRTAS